MEFLSDLPAAVVAGLIALAVGAALRSWFVRGRMKRQISIRYRSTNEPVTGARLRHRKSNTMTFATTDKAGTIPVPKVWGRSARVDVVVRGQLVLQDIVLELSTKKAGEIWLP